MEELLLEPAEEPLGGRVVRTAALRAHRPRQAVALADADPFVPPVVASTVRVDDRRLAGPERGARGLEHPVGQCGVGARADRPGDRHAVVAVDDRRQVHLARRDPELGDVRDPQPVRVRGVEVPVHEIGRRAADLAFVGAVALHALGQGHEPMGRHQAHDAFRGDDDARASELEVHTLVPVAAFAVLERLADLDWLQCIGLVHAGHDNEGVDHHGRSESSPSLRGGVQEADRAAVRERQAVVADQRGVRHPAFHAAALGAGDT